MTSQEPSHPHAATTGDSSPRRVHPRWIWGGLVVALLGAALLGLGISLLWLGTSIVGAAILFAGASMTVAGGMMNDARSGLAVRDEVRQVAEGDVHAGVAPGDMIEGSRAKADAARTSAQSRRTLQRANTRAPAPLAPLAGWLLVALAGVVVLSQPWFIEHTATGRNTAVRDALLAILVALSGLRIATARGLPRVAIVVAALAGAGFVAGGLLAHHSGRAISAVETAFGVFTILATVAAVSSPAPRRGASTSREDADVPTVRAHRRS